MRIQSSMGFSASRLSAVSVPKRPAVRLQVPLRSSGTGQSKAPLFVLPTTHGRGRYTGIVATVGPSCESLQDLQQLHNWGADLFRLNGSHGTREWHERIANLIRKDVRPHSPLGRPRILYDLPGPKVRLAEFTEQEVSLTSGSLVTLLPNRPAEGAISGDGSVHVALDQPSVYRDLRRTAEEAIAKGTLGSIVLRIGDGPDCELTVDRVLPESILLRVSSDSILKRRKGVNLSGVDLDVPFINERDRWGIEVALRSSADLLALSFVQSVKDVDLIAAEVDRRAADLGVDASRMGFIVKVETPALVRHLRRVDREGNVYDCFEELERVVEHPRVVGTMVASGDLALVIDRPAKLPFFQEAIPEVTKRHGGFVIMATGVLEGQKTSGRPHRNDHMRIYRSLCAHCDAIMLSDETASSAFWAGAVPVLHEGIVLNERFNELLEGFMLDADIRRTLARLRLLNPPFVAKLINAAMERKPALAPNKAWRRSHIRDLEFEERVRFAVRTLTGLADRGYPVEMVLAGLFPHRAARLLRYMERMPRLVRPFYHRVPEPARLAIETELNNPDLVRSFYP